MKKQWPCSGCGRMVDVSSAIELVLDTTLCQSCKSNIAGPDDIHIVLSMCEETNVCKVVGAFKTSTMASVFIKRQESLCQQYNADLRRNDWESDLQKPVCFGESMSIQALKLDEFKHF